MRDPTEKIKGIGVPVLRIKIHYLRRIKTIVKQCLKPPWDQIILKDFMAVRTKHYYIKQQVYSVLSLSFVMLQNNAAMNKVILFKKIQIYKRFMTIVKNEAM